MITATAATGPLARRLVERAEALAKARAVMMARRRDARRWRKASLLWPLFGED
ncbi:hypothetical protein [Novosphingobium sp. CECT 9465]|uniref:hypothetical protein n=1 Tax=Novosphingobium sp. CECT 9465 TaxID=2829794 RepID=UPI001E2F5187|nr:hypothetical protein [Novosphingobium sp. CECT 9465]CAH0497743.1 hypothetical protein NVSP9465_02812 [Novosphingobium sp. CECT 9465]